MVDHQLLPAGHHHRLKAFHQYKRLSTEADEQLQAQQVQPHAGAGRDGDEGRGFGHREELPTEVERGLQELAAEFSRQRQRRAADPQEHTGA